MWFTISTYSYAPNHVYFLNCGTIAEYMTLPESMRRPLHPQGIKMSPARDPQVRIATRFDLLRKSLVESLAEGVSIRVEKIVSTGIPVVSVNPNTGATTTITSALSEDGLQAHEVSMAYPDGREGRVLRLIGKQYMFLLKDIKGEETELTLGQIQQEGAKIIPLLDPNVRLALSRKATIASARCKVILQ